MKIRKVTPRLVEREMPGTAWNPRTRWSRKQIVLVFLETETGLVGVGVGEGWTSAGSARALLATIEDDIAPLILGEDIHATARLTARAKDTVEVSNRGGIVAAALAAVDIALHDLRGKALGLPLHQLLGSHDDRVFAYASAGLYGEGKTPGDLAAEVRGWIDQGFTAAKIKVGGAPLDEDVRRVAAVREAIGSAPKLMIDALYNLRPAEAIRLAHAVERYDIHVFEAPVSVFDVEGQARVARQSPIPICGNETLAWAESFARLIGAGAVDLVQFDPAVCGGITEGMRIAALASAHHRPVTLHASSSSVLFAAALHLAAACPNLHSLEYHMLHQWLFDLEPDRTFAIEPGGFVRPPPGPGLGLRLTPDDL